MGRPVYRVQPRMSVSLFPSPSTNRGVNLSIDDRTFACNRLYVQYVTSYQYHRTYVHYWKELHCSSKISPLIYY